MTAKAFEMHFKDLIRDFGDICIVDLLSDSKAREISLT
jgi:hypothetical protein